MAVTCLRKYLLSIRRYFNWSCAWLIFFAVRLTRQEFIGRGKTLREDGKSGRIFVDQQANASRHCSRPTLGNGLLCQKYISLVKYMEGI